MSENWMIVNLPGRPPTKITVPNNTEIETVWVNAVGDVILRTSRGVFSASSKFAHDLGITVELYPGPSLPAAEALLTTYREEMNSQ